jgi:hypothetical protein
VYYVSAFFMLLTFLLVCWYKQNSLLAEQQVPSTQHITHLVKASYAETCLSIHSSTQPTHLPTYGPTALCWAVAAFQFLNPIHRTTQTQ